MPAPAAQKTKTPGWLRAATMAAFAAATVAFVVRRVVEVVRDTRAIPPEEFPVAKALFSVYDALVVTQLVATVALTGLIVADLALRARGRLHRDDRVAGVALAVAVSGAWITFVSGYGALAAAIGLYAAFCVDSAHALGEAPPPHAGAALAVIDDVGIRHFWRRAHEVLLLPAASFLLLVGIELAQFTRPLAGELFAVDAFRRFAILAGAAAILAGFRLGLELALALLTIRAVARAVPPQGEPPQIAKVAVLTGLLMAVATPASLAWHEILIVAVGLAALRFWIRTQATQARLLAVSIVVGVYVWARTKDLMLAAYHDEIEALGLIALNHLLWGLCGILVAVWTHAGLASTLRRYRIGSYRDLVNTLVVALLCPAVPVLHRLQSFQTTSLRAFLARATALAAVGVALFTLLLVELNYPTFTDYSEFLQRIFSTLLGYTVFLLVFIVYVAVWRPGTGRQAAAAALTVVVALAAATGFAILESSQVSRMIGGQYSKVAWRSMVLARLLPEEPHLGLTDDDRPPDPGLTFNRMARLPKLPDGALTATARRPPIFVIIWDAARPDHMSVYGYHRRTTPRAEALAEDAVVFDHAFASATATTASIRHLLTGRFSSRYMLATDHAPFVTGLLHDEGYELFALNIMGSDFNGVSREAFIRNQPDGEAIDTHIVEFAPYEAQRKVAATVDILDQALAERAERQHPGDGLFFFLHFGETHFPWDNWDDHPVYGDGMVDRYDNSMGHADKALGDLIDALRERGLYDDAIIVLTADHGTGLGEHGRLGGFEPYQEQLRVPLLVKAPGFPHRHVAAPVSGIDLVPTIASLLRPGTPNPYDGFSLVDLMAGRTERLERRFLLALSAFEDALALIDLESGYKTIVHRRDRYEQLYDLTADPDERHNLADDEPQRVDFYLAFLRHFLWHRRFGIGNPYHYRELVVD